MGRTPSRRGCKHGWTCHTQRGRMTPLAGSSAGSIPRSSQRDVCAGRRGGGGDRGRRPADRWQNDPGGTCARWQSPAYRERQGKHPRLVTGQDTVERNSNEITAIPNLVSRLDLHEQVVTIDAMGCQRSIAAQIVAQGGASALALKDNHLDLATNVQDSFALATADPVRQGTTMGKGHGRIEIRTCRTITDPETMA